MGDKPYNQALFKAGMKIVKDNRQRQQNAYDAHAKAQMWGQVGNAITGVTGAFIQRNEMDKRQAAQDALGTQLGLDSGIARQLDPASMATLLFQQKNRGYVSPETQADIAAKQAQADMYKANAEYDRWRMTPEGATRSVGGGVDTIDITPELAKYAGGMTKVTPGALGNVISGFNSASQVQPPTEAQLNQERADRVSGSEELTRGLSRYSRYMGGDETIDPNDPLLLKYRTQLPDQGMADMRKRMDITAKEQATAQKQKAAEDVIKLRRDLDQAVSTRQSKELIAKITSDLMNADTRFKAVIAGNADTLGGMDEFGHLNTGFIGNKSTELLGSGYSAQLQDLLNALRAQNGGAAPVAPTAALQAPVAPEATTTLKPLSAEHIQRYNAASPEQKAQMKSAAQARGYDVSGLN